VGNFISRKTWLPLLVTVVFLGGATLGLAREKGKSVEESGLSKTAADRPEQAYFNMTQNNLWSTVSNFGSVGDPNQPTTGRPSMQWPGGSQSNYLYDGGLWAGTLLGGTEAVTTYFYSPHTEWNTTVGYPGEFIRGLQARSIQDNLVVFDDTDDWPSSNHVPLGLQVFRRALTWSLPEYSDAIVFEYKIVNTGLNGNLEDVYFSFWYDVDVAAPNDDSEAAIDDLVDYEGWDGNETETDETDFVDHWDLDGDGETGGYDEYGVPYNKDEPQNPNFGAGEGEPDGFFDEWGILWDEEGPVIHWQADASNEVYTAVAGEPAVINGDTLKGYLYPRNFSYIYDGDHPATSGNDYGERDLNMPIDGFFGGQLIYTPAGPYNTTVEDTFMRAYSHQWWNWESDPIDYDKDKWDYIQGRHESSLGYKFLPNPLMLGFPQFDYRFLLSTGPFDIADGDTVKLVYATIIGSGLKGTRTTADRMIEAYYKGSIEGNPYNPTAFDAEPHWVLPIPPNIPNLSYSPVDGGIKLAWDKAAEESFDPRVGAVDFEGYKIYRSPYEPGNWSLIAAFDNVNEPVSLVNTAGDTITDAPVNLPDIVNSYVDTGGVNIWGDTIDAPLNGIPYYYAVAAYDPDKPELGVTSSESPLSNYKTSASNAPIPVYPGKLYESGETAKPMSSIKVVPNPYKGAALWEERYEDRVRFSNLPPVCRIQIFSLAGDLVDTIQHDNGTDFAYWDLVSRNNQSVVSGVYVYAVETENDKHVGKFVVLR